jgi:hypothetical protein
MNSLTRFRTNNNLLPKQLTNLIEAWEVSLKDGKKDVVWFEYGPWRATAKYFHEELESIKFVNRDIPEGRSDELRVFIEDGKVTEFKFAKKGFKYSCDNGIARWDGRRSIWILPELQMTFDADGKIAHLWTELRRDIEAHIELYLRGESFAGGYQQWAINSFGFFAFDESERIKKVSGDIPDITGERVSMDYVSTTENIASENENGRKTDIVTQSGNILLNYYISIGEQTITIYMNGDMIDSFYLTPTLPDDIQALFGIKNISQLIEVVGEMVNDLNK